MPNTLLVTLADETTVEYALRDFPEISFSGTDLVIVNKETTVSFTRDEVQRYEIVYREYNADSGIGTLVEESDVTRDGDTILIHSLRGGDRVAVYSVDGRLLYQTVTDDSGDTRVSLQQFGKGVYLLNINKFTTKIIWP